MASDLVERLQRAGAWSEGVELGELLIEAAQEIVQHLRRTIDRAVLVETDRCVAQVDAFENLDFGWKAAIKAAIRALPLDAGEEEK